jgi:apolipoprotein N-acyltransferase
MSGSWEEPSDVDSNAQSGRSGLHGFQVRPQPATSGLPAWVWLVVGLLLLPFTMVQTVIPLVAWAAPIFLLRFVRTAKRGVVALLAIFVAYLIGISVATRGGSADSFQILVLDILLFEVTRALLYSLAYAADRAIGSRLSRWPRLFVFPVAFTALEWILSLGKAPNTTGSLAYSQYSSLALMQILSVTGMWGVIFLITWCASTVNLLWEHGFEWRRVRPMVGVYAGVLLTVLVFGYARLLLTPPPTQSIEAATITLDPSIQRAAEAGIDWLALGQATDAQREAVGVQLEPIINQMLARTEAALRGGAKIVVWAEGSGTILEEDQAESLGRVQALAREYGAYIEPALAVAIRTKSQYFLLNQAILIDPAGKVQWTYEKTFPTEPVESYYTVAGTGVLPVIGTPYGVMSSAICNDLHFPPLIRQAGWQNVDIFLAPVNDVHPFKAEDEIGAVYRAIENGFSLVRPADYGFSTIVDYQGRVLAIQDYFGNTSGVMMTTVPIHGVRTIYSRTGDVFAYFCVAAVVLLMGLAVLPRKQLLAGPAVVKP